LRSATSLIQIIGRAARNVNGKVVMYADKTSDAMKEAIEETARRREIQQEFNKAHGVTPKTISKAVEDLLTRKIEDKKAEVEIELSALRKGVNLFVPAQRNRLLKALEKQMIEHADRLEYEEAAAIRDEIEDVKARFK
jgi:excinuclease ABC subunit B